MPTPRKILILSANPSDTQRLETDAELVAIWQRLQHRNGFAVKTATAATLDTLRALLLDEQPELLHFSGHGEAGELLLHDDDGKRRILSAAMLRPLLQTQPRLRCVLLNACHSAALAQAIQAEAQWLIAMQDEISDIGAGAFTRGFYDALVRGIDYPQAFEIACTALIHQAYDESAIPLLLQGGKSLPPPAAENAAEPPRRTHRPTWLLGAALLLGFLLLALLLVFGQGDTTIHGDGNIVHSGEGDIHAD